MSLVFSDTPLKLRLQGQQLAGFYPELSALRRMQTGNAPGVDFQKNTPSQSLV